MTQTEKNRVTEQLQEVKRITGNFQPQSDKYLQFIVKELKPYIDKKYAVFTNRENTFIAGSSMGALLSIYAICEYPKIFAGAACLSTHWAGIFTSENNPVPAALISYLKKKLPRAGSHRIYFDCGDQGLDSLYPPIQVKIDRLMQARGYSARNWITKYFPGEDHSERAWKKRLHLPVTFLFGK